MSTGEYFSGGILAEKKGELTVDRQLSPLRERDNKFQGGMRRRESDDFHIF
jgi:hypothetical protein